MGDSPSEHDQDAFYTCIASDSLLTSDGETISAQLSANFEIAELFNGSEGDCALFTPSQVPDANTNRTAEAPIWQCQQSPEGALIALQNCKLWFLFTDGKHENSEEDNFARRARCLGVVNYPCVIVLFGASSDGPPPSTKYQVCYETISNASNALFLFHDIGTGQNYIFQAKGCFSNFSAGRINISLENQWKTCKWAQLRRFQYENLRSTTLPPPQSIDHVDQLTVHERSIMTNGEYQTMMATRDVGDRFDIRRLQEIIDVAGKAQTYKPLYAKASLPSDLIQRVDINGQANHNIHGILMNLDFGSVGMDVDERRVNEYREELRAANKANRLAFREAQRKERAEGQTKSKSFLLPVSEPEATFFPGFIRAPMKDRQHSEHRGSCMLCHTENVILVLLLHSAELVNDDHLLVISLPLVFDTLVVCDACAVHFPAPHNVLEKEVVAALPLVSVIDNEAAWERSFGAVVEYLVRDDEILPLVSRWLSTQVRYKVGELKPGDYKEALDWLMGNLEKWMDTTRNRRFDIDSI
ncbi:hypothetical protein EG329_013296 [Mollisiaceae sp. DMI_Dod_QoI]|nr:hypothetical protein EG329_013296 [Helotiales sp. DMI_Dod_QoI]